MARRTGQSLELDEQSILMDSHVMTKEEFKSIRERFGYSQTQMAKMLGWSAKPDRKWAHGNQRNC